jgi:signal transduction histidine kinase/ActR/RegA family two-component response regulator
MPQTAQPASPASQQQRLIGVIAVIWLALLGLSLFWNWQQVEQSALLFAEAEAEASYSKDLIYRRWASLQGGVYVPPTATTPPNPYLAHLPDRDLRTTDGRELTLVNPAYMTRQVHDLGREAYGTQGHITSLKPLNPGNSPDPWEKEALLAFVSDSDREVTLTTMAGEPYLRFIRPLRTERDCLKCHAAQGYREGDIRGGISVSVPFAPYAKAASRQQFQLLLAHLLLGGLGLLGLWQGNRLLQASATALARSREQAEEEQKRFQAQLQQAQKMEAIGTLAGGIAHDFNNILSVILGYAEMARGDTPTDSRVAEEIDQVIIAANRAKELVKQILAFSREAKAEKVPLLPALIVTETLKLIRSSFPSTIAIDQELAGDTGTILADPTQIHQMLLNLCTNAFHAMEEHGGTLTVRVKSRYLSSEDLANRPHTRPGKFVEISVSDTGTGIPAEIRDRIFDPYFTTKEVGRGTGMGLAIVHGIVTGYGGFVTCDSRPQQGTVFRVFLPEMAEGKLPLTAETTASAPVGNERILLVDDEEMLAAMSRTMLQRLGYTVTVHSSGQEALADFTRQPEAFDLVITDQTMPAMTGTELAAALLRVRPDLPIILCTGYSSLITKERAMALGIRGFALKPLSRQTIAGIIREALAGLPRQRQGPSYSGS